MSPSDATTVRLSQLSPAKRALLEKRLQRRMDEATAVQTIGRRGGPEGPLPLSFAQQRLWFIDQLQPNSAAYNVPAALRLTGPLNVEALERCINEIVRRHEVLRTTFTLGHDRQPLQVVAPELKHALRVEDLSALPEAERESEAVRLTTEEARRPFDLARGPLLRARLLRLGDDEHVLLFTMHHIVSDGWSMGVLVREIGAIYSAYARGAESPLPELPIQYADFALWQRDWLQGAALAEQLAYWREHLGGELPVLQLPTDHARPPVQTYQGGHVPFALGKDLSDRLRQFAHAEGATTFMLMLAAFQVLLRRYTGQEDILVGTPIANRNRAETEGLIGFFVNTLVLRADLSGNPTFRELLRRVQRVSLGAYAHQDLPFEKLVEELHPDRDLSRNPLVQVILALQNAPMGDLELHGLTARPLEFESDVVRFDLEFHVHELPDGIAGLMAYNGALFERETVGRLIKHLTTLLEGIAADPDRRIGDLPLLTPQEREQLLSLHNDTRRDPPPARTIHQLIEAQAERTPDAAALEFGGEVLSYRELNGRADRLARRLRALGVGPEVRVGLVIERSAEQIIGLLGVLKAGGAYVPVEASAPRERARYVLEDAGARVVVTTDAALGEEVKPEGAEVVGIGAEGWEAEGDGGPVESGVGGENAAYVIYTSGSTGRPKGVVVSHASLVNSVLAPYAERVEAVTSSLMLMSYAFDGSMLSIFYALFQGGRLSLPREGEQADPAQVARLIAEKGITYVCVVPSFYKLLLEQARAEQLRSLRVVHVAAEAVPPKLVEGHFRLIPEAQLVNIYGPTEITVWCCSYEFRAGEALPPVPIGHPSRGMQAYVLDEHLQPAPVGVAGELYAGGAGVARGYLNRPGLTAERFVPDPFGDEPGARLYRTGDRVRVLPSGEIEYLGRFDHQVKVRGYRIELGEIEAALARLDGVREAAVVVREDEAGDKRLVGYVAADGGRRLSAGELRGRLQRELPEYMTPSAFVLMEGLPRTASGKVNRTALPAPEKGRDAVAERFVAPRTPIEELLARIWGEVLKLESVGINDDFFDLGGHSLLATQLVSRVRESFAVELPLRALFESPTVAGLAERVEAAMRAGQGASVQPLVPVERGGDLPLSFAQQRLWFIHKLEPSGSAYNMPVAVRLVGRLNVAALERTLGEIVSRHESLRTSFGMSDGQPVQIIAPPAELCLPVSDLSHLPEGGRMAEARSRASEDARRPFDLERGPLYRLNLLRLGDEDHVLLFTMHHIVSDGWSMGVLVREVAELYSAFAEGEPSPLAELPIQYADFAHWQRTHLAGEVLETHWQYWKRQLGGTLPVLELPTDRPRPAVQSFRGASLTLDLPAALAERLNALARREGATLFMLLLAAFKATLHRYTGQEDIVVGSPIANRNRIETEGLIGFFVNTLALRTDLSGSPSLRELLRRVRTVALEAYAHQDMPFEQLVEQLQPDRSMNRHPLFQVMFQLGNAPMGDASLPGLTLQAVETERTTTQFDLSIDIAEGEDGLLAVAEYSTDLFDAPTVGRMLGHFRNVLERVAEDPEESIARVPLLSDAERGQLVAGWAGAGGQRPAERCLHELFEAQAAREPEAAAVVAGGERLTYAALNNRANQLARHLRSRGVGPETRVGVLSERSPEMVVALLAVLKAGGAYVPLDPSYPRQRLAFILKDAGASALITRARLKELIPEREAEGLHVVCLDADGEAIAGQSTSDLAAAALPENLAYVVYTSGSTGRPKGVAVSHASLVSHQAAVRDAYGLSPDDRVLQFASLGFDVAAEEIFPTLLCGATLVLRDDEAPGVGEGLLRQLREHRVSVLNLPASAWHEWAGELSRDGAALPGCLRLLVVGSERVLSESLAGWGEMAGAGTRLMNAYGTTETTITATLYQPAAGMEAAHAGPALPIGRPIANTRAYILDPLMQPVPVGVVGELYVGGRGLARGYLDRAGLTAETFIPHPFADEPGARLYKTGDLARYLTDGNIEFVGRADHQVKVRGYRIELGEVEAALNEQRGVREAVVMARPDVDGQSRLVAYVVAGRNQEVTKRELRERLRERLPEFMVPPVFVMLDELPLAPGGKVDRRALPAPDDAPDDAEESVAPRSEVERAIAAVWREVLRRERVGVNDNFFDLGGHSLLLVQVHNRLRKAFDAEITMLDLFKYPTISALAGYIAPAGQPAQPPLPRQVEVETRQARAARGASDIAVIGMSGRFPGARGVEQFWENLRAGVESVSFFSDEELIAAGVDPALVARPDYVKAGVVLEDVEQFDASFFGYSPREAEVMDPQHRLFLECAWEALERAGHDPERDGGPVGVFAGAGVSSYAYNLLSHPEIVEAVGGLQIAIGNDKDHLPTHVSYKLNLRGPSVAVQTACSTSLVAVHMACQSLLNGECRTALAGGVSIHGGEKQGYLYQEGGIYSPDGHCRAFDEGARGTISGSGVGVVVLKRLADALADGDHVHAVIKGSAVNNDGSQKVGYTAPSVEGQAEAIREAQRAAGVGPETIGYVEAHGTGTPLGDPIEIAALTQVFRRGTDEKGFCAVGSLKTNLGHLDTAAGVAGLMKTVLALEHRTIPPSLNFTRPNPALDLDNSPFYVSTEASEWPARGGGPRRAGVSSFGIGGTNAHVVLEEAPTPEPSGESRPWQLLMLSARTETALEQATANLAAHLDRRPDASLADVAYTLQVGRKTFGHRRVLVCRGREDARDGLEALHPERVLTSAGEGLDRNVVFMFPGQGAQHVGMGLGLYRQERVFREQVDGCCETLRAHLGFDLRDVLYPRAGEEAEAAGRLRQTQVTQPALFVVEYALARLWMSWGVRPAAMIGHSVGEYVAACLAGVFSLEDALQLVALRGRLIQSLPEGAMLSVPLAEDELRDLLGEELSVAAVNGPSLCTASGPREAIDELRRGLASRGVDSKRLHTSHAFHSRMMAPAVAEFNDEVRRVRLGAPQMRYVSNVTGTWVKADDATDPAYWAQHLRRTVRFADGVREVLKDANALMLGVGPGHALGAMVKPLAREAGQPVINSMRHPDEQTSDEEVLIRGLGRLWLAGVRVDWRGFYADEVRRRVPLPTYPFERRRYWVGWQGEPAGERPLAGLLRKKPDVADWFYVPFWKPSVLPAPAAAAEPALWLVLQDGGGFGARVAEHLARGGAEVYTVKGGETFERRGERDYTINIARAEDYEALLGDLKARGPVPSAVLHSWGLDAPDSEQALSTGFQSLVFLARALGRHNPEGKIQLAVLTDAVQRVTGEERIVPEKAAVLGPCRVIPREYPNIACRSVDVLLAAGDGRRAGRAAAQVAAELVSGARDTSVAYRSGQRWTQAFEPVRLEAAAGARSLLRQGGVYLITGGMGGIGLALAEHLARTRRARLALVGRSPLPAKEEWALWLAAHEEGDEVSVKIRRLQAIESLGAEVFAASADVSDEAQMREALRLVRERFGAVNGVIHAAGVAPGGMIETKTPETMAGVLAPKVRGTRVLESLLEEEPLDFLVLFSSLDSVLGSLGLTDYCAANAFLDAFAHYHVRRTGTPTLAINWDAWGEAGMAFDAKRSSLGRAEGGEQLRSFFADAISSSEGADAFERLLAHELPPQVLVSARDLNAVIERTEASTPIQILEEGAQSPQSRPAHARPSMQTAYVAPRGELEGRIAAVWQDVLGLERVGVHDNFFDLGGHSLLATQLVSRLREFSRAEIPLRVVFERPTVATLAQHIEHESGNGAEASSAPSASRPPEIVPIARQARAVKRPRKT
ncbi:MAG TPA: amino acid adenylation domain-containing protein [Pyrinomonadaceae bacterium]|nr:amino acid adenylation domain-containing protein [Pyrinomonadaceae bacterium]